MTFDISINVLGDMIRPRDLSDMTFPAVTTADVVDQVADQYERINPTRRPCTLTLSCGYWRVSYAGLAASSSIVPPFR
ncbi:hypothetical protein PhaeoP97_01702 [Phaeobacter porticola]|uniref:Uncharacterized protein n=1 Tax=Phaeobacter porticola TaxID=1844006 RepID=A0A1L3I4W4_9RHOB|nr:hypothetical protein PhaeoP97_01702 [Phaeobacter porticola]